MKKIILLLVFCSASLNAQFLVPDAPPDAPIDELQQAFNPRQIVTMTSYYKRPFDVQRYDLYMDWRAPLSAMSMGYPGVNTITLVSDSMGLNSVLLDAAGMRIDSIRVNGTMVAPVQPDSNQQINILLGKSYNMGDTITLIIGYTHISTNQQGFYLYDKGTYGREILNGDSVFIPERIAYTMSEPLDAHWWMPCMDLPYDKALSEIRVAVPDSFVVSSNGLLQSVAPAAGGGNVYDWKMDIPIATYLMCATASVFSTWSAYYTRVTSRSDTANYIGVTNPSDSVRIMYYVWPQDSTAADTTGQQFNARYAFENIPFIMQQFSMRYGEFPYPKYGMTALQPFNYGGMEHTTMTSIIRSWLLGRYGEQGMAHEMTHQWFGDDITCATWKDIWLNEGFATFGEDLYHEFVGGESGYMNNVMTQVRYYLNSGNNATAIYDPVGQGKNVFNWGTTYLKGGITLYMLHTMLGDSAYFSAMRYYLTKFNYSAATTDDFADAISEATGQDLHWFINQWVYGKGQPLYKVEWWTVVAPFNTWNVHVQINQPDTTRQLFRMPIPLRYYRGATVTDTIVIDSLRSQEFVVNMPFPVDSVVFDPDYHVLKDPSSFVTTYVASSMPLSTDIAVHVAPNPAHDDAMLLYNIAGESHATLQISDALGRSLAEFPLGGERQGIADWNVQSVPAGVYYARLATAHGIATAQIQVIK
ncbi:MAG TPA: M1 family aminopeptidase [Candidatus Kapabacteria bacterium]|nr:M1 family aminopeptidase [Candidatus Kapabacteria bacterium]